MNSRPLTEITPAAIHGSFTLTLDLAAPPARVYAAYADPAQRRRWFRYAVTVNDIRRWVSLVTIELCPQDAGTHLRHTEHYAFLAWTGDGRHDVAHLKGGTRLQLNGLLAALSDRS